MKRLALAALATLILPGLAVAQQIPRVGGANADRIQTLMTTFQLSRNIPTSTPQVDLTNGMARATQSLYDIINRQCEVIGLSFKGECRLVLIQINGNIGNANYRSPPGGGLMFNATATATFEIETKDPAPADDPPKAPKVP